MKESITFTNPLQPSGATMAFIFWLVLCINNTLYLTILSDDRATKRQAKHYSFIIYVCAEHGAVVSATANISLPVELTFS